ncbi:Aldo/keto reductase [Dichomitus squalens LYAD-421 SS1]|uniref:Aldo/keto reductase n=1 Tax=Dichomitus squalens (strain LYAD-421) TaxID=732165 RepID=UPI00044147E0|nr:Aldo/keto reductase [Dichomitus squalens LYAD-421 SS1]EJF63951.1 Aldo/keto reductase [Dichomitus squalens LYAD-421 SS1]
MPWARIQLNDGTSIPTLAYGTGRLKNGDSVVGWVKQAITAGFVHLDVAQAYANEEETGKAISESGVPRESLYITTKFSGRDNLTILEAAQQSIKKLGVDHVDLYLIHHPRFATPDIPTAWAQLEKLKADGLTKSLGVSNFNEEELQAILDVAKVKPVANQIMVHPYNLAAQLPVIEFGNKHGIVTEGYSPLQSLRSTPGGPVDKPVNDIAARLSATPEQVLLAWAKSKNIVVITSSRDHGRVVSFLGAGDLELTAEDIAAIDEAGNKGALWSRACSKAGTVLPWEEGKLYDA